MLHQEMAVSSISTGKVADLADDVRKYKPRHVIVIARKALRLSVPSGLRAYSRISWIDCPATFGRDESQDTQIVQRFLKAATTLPPGACHIACEDGESLSVAAAYVMLCVNARPGQEGDVADCVSRELPTGRIDDTFVRITDTIVQRGDTLSKGLQRIKGRSNTGGVRSGRLDMKGLKLAS
jgi:hypothetical protein